MSWRSALASRSKAAAEANGFLMPMVRELRDGGATLAAVAEKLNAEGHTIRTGKAFSAATLHHLLAR